MKRKALLVVLVAVLCATSFSCTCSAEKGAVSRLQDQQGKVFDRYTAYVAKDPALSQAQKDDEFKLLQSIRDIVSALKRSLGD